MVNCVQDEINKSEMSPDMPPNGLFNSVLENVSKSLMFVHCEGVDAFSNVHVANSI